MLRTQSAAAWAWTKAFTLAILLLSGVQIATAAAPAAKPAPSLPQGPIVLPLDRTAYFIGETIPLALTGDADVKLEAVNPDGRVLLYQGKPGAILLNTTKLSHGDYTLQLNGADTATSLSLTSTLRKSAASMQDEAMPSDAPQLSPQESKDPAIRARKIREHADSIARTLTESGLTACIGMGAPEMPRKPVLDAMARAGALLLINPDTRPISFNPTGVDPIERDAMSQRMILTAQANGRYPNFGGFCFGWDTTGYALDGRKGLLVYWGWGNQEQALRHYIARQDKLQMDEFTRRTGMPAVTYDEYLSYALSLGKPEFAPGIDLPTKRWLEETAKYMKPMPEAQRQEFEKRLDAWSSYLMGIYRETYGVFATNLRSVDPALRNTTSVQVDHCPTINGQYFPEAYQSLDFQYQTTWNDQVGGPDYAYQWLFTAGLLDMRRGDKPTWISNAIGAAHARSLVPRQVRPASPLTTWPSAAPASVSPSKVSAASSAA